MASWHPFFMDFGRFWEASWEGNRSQDRPKKASKNDAKKKSNESAKKVATRISTDARTPGSWVLGRCPPKGLVNHPPPGDIGPPAHFSTPFPSNPFPSSSFPFPSLRFPCLPLSWPVLACLGSIFPPNLAPTWFPKSTQSQTKWSLGGLPYLDLVFTSIFVRFLLRTWTPQTPKIIEISFVLY